MASTTPNLGLKVWNLGSDTVKSSDLADNWAAIDADYTRARTSNQVEALAAVPGSGNFSGRLVYLTAANSGFQQYSIIRYNGTTWKVVGPGPELVASLPTVNNFQGRIVVLSASSGGFVASDVVVNTDGANSWKKVGGIGTGAALPGSASAGDMFLLTSAASGFEAYSLVAYNGSAWARTEKRGVEFGAALPGAPFAGQVYVLTSASGNYKAYDVVRYNGSSWAKVNGPIFVDNTALSALTPTDGMEVHYQPPGANGAVWHMRYNSGSASTYKWEVISGVPLTGTTSVTITRAGDYIVEIGDQGTIKTYGTAPLIMNVSAAGTTVQAAGGIYGGGTQDNYYSIFDKARFNGITAATTLTISVVSGTAGRPQILAYPIRMI